MASIEPLPYVLDDLMLSCVEQEDHKGYTFIHLFGRSRKNKMKRYHFRVFGFLPNFYVLASIQPESILSSSWEKYIIDIRDDPMAPRELLRNRRVKNIVVRDSDKITSIRDKFYLRENTFNADLIYKFNFLVRKDIRSGFKIDLRDSLDNAQYYCKGFDFEQKFIETNAFYNYNNVLDGYAGTIVSDRIIDILRPDRIEPVNVFFEPRKHYLDIETDNFGKKNPSVEKAERAITHIGFYDNYIEKLVIYTHKAKEHDKIKKLVDRFNNILFKYELKDMGKEIEWRVKTFKTEQEMFKEYITFVRDNEPDMILGWNVKYDIDYIVNRLRYSFKKIPIDDNGNYYTYKSLSPVGSVFYDEFYDRYIIQGFNVFDLLEGYKRITYAKGLKESWGLGDTGIREVKYGKITYKNTLGWNWRYNFVRILKYNARDVELIVVLDKKLNISNYFWIRSRTTGCMLDNVFFTGSNIDSDIVRFCLHSRHRVLPNSNKTEGLDEAEEEMVKGAHVIKPKRGVYKNVMFFDFKAWYFSIIFSLNLSPDVMIKEIEDCIRIRVKDKSGDEVRFFIDKTRDGVMKERILYYNKLRDDYKKLTLIYENLKKYIHDKDGKTLRFAGKTISSIYDDFKRSLKKRKTHLLESDFDVLVSDITMQYGTFNDVIMDGSFIDFITYMGEIVYELYQTSQKFMVNSFYGVMLHAKFRLYNKKIGMAIPAIGVMGLIYTLDLLESIELRNIIKKKTGIDIIITILYGDTDSIAITGFEDITDKDVLIRISSIISDFLTSKYGPFFKKKFNTDVCNASIRCEHILKAIAFVDKISKSKKGSDGDGAKKKYFELTWLELVGENEWKETIKFKKKGYGKSDMPIVLKKYEKKIQALVLLQSLGVKTRQDIITFLRHVVISIRKATPEMLCFRKSLKPLGSYKAFQRSGDEHLSLEERKGVPIHVRAAIYARRYLHSQINVGDKVKYVYVKSVPDDMPETNVIAFSEESEIKGFEMDVNKQTEAFFRSVQNIVSLANIDLKTDVQRVNKDVFNVRKRDKIDISEHVK